MEVQELLKPVKTEESYRDKFLEALDRIDELKKENEKLHKALLNTVLRLE